MVIDQRVKVAIIMAIPPTISAFMWGWVNHKKIGKVEEKVGIVEVNTNNKLTKLLEERNTATTRADKAEAHAEGRTEGVAAQRPEKEPNL
jgi:hypothetical protein